MSSEIASSRKGFSASAARILLGRLLRCGWLLCHLLHRHIWHVTHGGHVRIACHLHGSRHRVRDVHRGLHHGRGGIPASHVMMVGVLRVL